MAGLGKSSREAGSLRNDRHRRGPRPLVISAVEESHAAEGERSNVGANAGGFIHSSGSGSQRPFPDRAGRCAVAGSANVFRSDRTTAAIEGRRWKTQRSPARFGDRSVFLQPSAGFRSGSAARIASLRRALGEALARSGAVRRQRRPGIGRRSAERLSLSRFRDPRAQ